MGNADNNFRHSVARALGAASMLLCALACDPGFSGDGDPNQPPPPPTNALVKQPVTDESRGLARVNIVPPEGERRPIDLAGALGLAQNQNPVIAKGREAIREALALQLGARALMLPTLNAGVDYHRHDGTLQASTGDIRSIDSQSLYFGAGDVTFGAQTVLIPGVHVFGNVADAVYAPLAAGQVVNSRSADSRGIENATLLVVAEQYLELLRAEAELGAVRRSEDNLRAVLSATAAFAETGKGRIADYHRARTRALLLHRREEQIQERVAVASAELSRTLHMDPSIQLTVGDGTIEPVRLVDPAYRVEDLIEIAQRARPEAAARTADISAAEYRLQQEYARPFLPLLSVGFSAGGFGGGSEQVGASWQHTSGRTDFDAYAVWSLDNLGFGNCAVQKERRADRDEAVARRGLVLNRIAREVADAYAQAKAARKDLELAQKQLATARQGAGEEIIRTRNGQGLPLEAINSVDQLVTARDEMITTLIAYDRAEFRLFVAIGQTPSAAISDPHR